jgi:hypothetical protein
MVNVERCIAGVAIATGALMLIWKGEITAGTALLGSMVGFFIGEANGKKNAKASQ